MTYQCKAVVRRGWLAALAWMLVCSFWSGQGAEKPIRLRNEVISTPEKVAVPRALAAEAPANGLYLVQFNDHFQAAWGEELAAAGVKLLWYVPEDAFVARLERARLSDLTSKAYIRWVGPYQPAHKVHQGLAAPGLAAPGAQEIRVLVTPTMTAEEKAALKRIMPAWLKASPLRNGGLLHCRATPAQLKALAECSAVVWIERASQPKLCDEIATKIVAGDDFTNATQALVHQLGFDGAGVTVAVADSGLHNGDSASMHPDLAGRTPTFIYYGNLLDAADEHSHGTHVTGIIAGNAATGEQDEYGFLYGLGVAPAARIVTQRLFDGAGNYEAPPSFGVMARDAVRAGAAIGSNSWGDDTQGRYDLSAMEFDALVRDADDLAFGDQPYILEFSAGNAGPGPQTVGSPAVAKNVIATGASQNNRGDLFLYEDGVDAMADFSSRGPCEDGRIKPDVVAPGTWITSAKSASATDENAWGSISENYIYMGGTSQAGPHASGAAAVFVQFYRMLHTNQAPSPALVKAALINSAVDMDDAVETDPAPNNDEGWGRIDLTQIIGAERHYDYVDQTATLSGGQVFERRQIVNGGHEPLKITLTYTDVPGLPAAIPALVNDLDLEVIAPDGQRYHGNQFEFGESSPNPAGFDRLNNVEGVLLSEPVPGEYLIRVRAYNVPQDARQDTPAVDQDFALVTSGPLAQPSVGAIFMDRAFYTAPSRIKVTLFDSDLAGQPGVNVLVRSGAEPAGESLTLLPAGTAGLFTNSLATATGAAAADGRLQLVHSNLIEVIYQDVSAGLARIATAQADFVPPIASGIAVTNNFGRMVISWQTDEPAAGMILYGTNTALGLTASNRLVDTEAVVELAGLLPGRTYYFAVTATDIAGNRATNSNGGAFYTFVAASPGTVLLVDDYVLFAGDDSPVIDQAVYTSALAQSGLSYEVWNVEDRGYPTTNDLRSFKVVFWRVNDSLWGGLLGYQGLLAPQQQLLSKYVQSGGSLMIASMELLSRMGTNGLAFRSNVLQVASFVEDAGVSAVQGPEFDSLTSGVLMDLDYINYESAFLELLGQTPDVSDTIIPTTNAVPVLYAAGTSEIVGLRYPRTGQDTDGRVVFLAIPFDALPATGPEPNNRAALLKKLLGFLAPGQSGAGTVSLDSGHYRVPSLVIIEVGDADLADQGTLVVSARTSTQTNAITVTLNETIQRGVFRGFLTLAAATNTPAAGQLRASHGDQITVEYLDNSASATVTGVALVDIISPDIELVEAVADYEDITVTWSTTESTDALVQYGEAPTPLSLTRTAYRATLESDHELVLLGLQPDKTYYFQVVCRDAAGNTTVDDNGGQYYQARTLKPLVTPYRDAFDVAGPAWTVFDGDDSMTSWQQGVPDNGMETEAHSAPNAWGSNLNGNALDWADTFLISPAIQLSGGNKATLRFWHSYDFSEQTAFDLVEGGVVYVFTNRATDPIVLAEFTDWTDGWTPVELDLTPYLGRTIYLVWYYSLISFEPAPRTGWLVDDVAVEVTNIVPGIIIISNNLSQALFSLSGAMSRSGGGLRMELTNALPGDYTLTYSDVPYYQKPAAQTATLRSSEVLVFSGNYVMPDANANGVSDLWEQEYFGQNLANPALTDQDGDGMSDWAEFIAGTNPTNANSRLDVSAASVGTNDTVRLVWPTVPGRSYQLLGSTNLTSWTSFQDWSRAGGNHLSTTLGVTTNGTRLWLKLQARP